MALIIPTGCADDLTPKVCTSNLVPSETSDGACYQVTIDGADDVTIIQGADFDPTDGVVAYDGHGDEIDFSFSPSEIAECEVGKQTIRYSATGYGTRIKPHFPCLRKNKLHISEDCGNDTDTAVVYRTITVEQADPPTISGVDDVTVQPNTDFNALSGVSAVDAHGNAVDVKYSGSYDLEATGNPAEFEADESTGIKSLEVDLEPIQDLNGYSKPWVGGAGKNLLENPVRTWTTSGITFSVHDDGSVSISGTATANAYLNIVNWATFGDTSLAVAAGKEVTVNGATTGIRVTLGYREDSSQTSTNIADTTGAGKTGTLPNDLTYQIYVAIRVDSGMTVDTVLYPMIRLASNTDPTWEPYENICPISGHTSVETHRTGRNLLDNTANSTTVSGITYRVNSDGSVNVDGRATVSDGLNIDTNISLPSGNYVLTGCPNGGGNVTYVIAVVINGVTRYDRGSGASFSIADGDVINRVRIVVYANATADNLVFKPMIRLATDTDSTYEPYQGETYTTDLGRTVYGGTLDLVSGVLTVDRAMVDLGTLTWTYVSSALGFWSNLPLAVDPSTHGQGDTQAVCSAYRRGDYPSDYTSGCFVVSDGNISSVKRVWIREDNYTDATAFKASLSGQTLVYTLATPQTYQLTPQEVEALVGTNVVWSDGSVTVVYSHEMPQGTFQFPVEGIYNITYSASDKCGNTRTRSRRITVGSYRTVLYKDKTLIINEASWDMADNIRVHGTATNVYPAFDPNGSTDVAKYIFADRTDQPWFAKREDILTVIIGSPIKPTSTAYWFTNFTTCEEIDVSLLDTSRVTNMAFMFAQCPSLTFLDIYHFDTSKVTNMSGMFNYCRDIESLDITNFDTSNVTDMSHMFAECRTLTELDLSTFATYDVTDMTSMFYLDDALTTIYVTGAFSVSRVSASDNMFYRCDVIEGGNGTTYDEEYIDKTYARIDGEEPGYFTAR